MARTLHDAPYQVVTVSTLTVRSGPSASHPVVGHVLRGGKVQDFGRFGGWTRIAPSRWVTTNGTKPASAPSFVKAAITSTYSGIPIEAGTYVMWKKDRNLVLLVRRGKVVRAMRATDNDWKTIPGNYRVLARSRTGSSVVDGVTYRLPYFVHFGQVPGRTGIGFHSIPVTRSGTYIQPASSIGTPGYESAGCLRLTLADATALATFVSTTMAVRVRS